nr:immunoglobulin light chain junction region [Mus musculus]NSL96992.1 immunoglobulin light chain junction region [Mus musculus]NSL97008.1 immunoglobulin light chain junction region [Mus musculus]NSL97028.1 immunoglobulin light chain junction region [Mus musculus]NSL97039.1 immunoglobulin light chain junction region [Mus musculus]
CQQGNTLPWTF